MLATADPVLHPRTTDPHDDDAVALAHELADARRRIAALTALSELGVALATASRREELYRLACAGVRRLLDADGCRLHLVDADGGRLEPAYASPREALGADARPARFLDALRAGAGERAGVASTTRRAPAWTRRTGRRGSRWAPSPGRRAPSTRCGRGRASGPCSRRSPPATPTWGCSWPSARGRSPPRTSACCSSSASS